MRLSGIRLLVATLISISIVFTFWHRQTLSTYLPPEAKNYFHPSETTDTLNPLAHVVQEFVARPILTYEESVKANSETCPTEGVAYDYDGVKGNAEKWSQISSTKISDWRHGIAAYLYEKYRDERERVENDMPVEREGKRGRGIVMAAGDKAAVVRARTNVRFLRSYNCSLPIEIFHFANELSTTDKELLSDLSSLEVRDDEEAKEEQKENSVTVRVVEGVKKDGGWKEFQIKGAAIQQSSFDEILYLDTDSYLLRNPEYLFESKQWKDTGLLLWMDYTKSHPTNPLWRLLGQPCRDEYEGESGQILISRTKHQDLLWLVEYFAIHHDEFYGFMGGDRDSFRAAALLLEKKWAGPGRLIAAAGGKIPDGSVKKGGHTMLQADMEGKWTFVHANLIKHGHFSLPLWEKIQRVKDDKYAEGTTYGNIEGINKEIGKGIRTRVDQAPRIETTVVSIGGFGEEGVVVEDWDSYEELRGFEERWFGFGGVR